MHGSSPRFFCKNRVIFGGKVVRRQVACGQFNNYLLQFFFLSPSMAKVKRYNTEGTVKKKNRKSPNQKHKRREKGLEKLQTFNNRSSKARTRWLSRRLWKGSGLRRSLRRSSVLKTTKEFTGMLILLLPRPQSKLSTPHSNLLKSHRIRSIPFASFRRLRPLMLIALRRRHAAPNHFADEFEKIFEFFHKCTVKICQTDIESRVFQKRIMAAGTRAGIDVWAADSVA